jgi:hypothetical protein
MSAISVATKSAIIPTGSGVPALNAVTVIVVAPATSAFVSPEGLTVLAE